MEKQKLREFMKSQSIDNKKYADGAILKNILKLPEYKKASVIFTYVSMEKEPDTFKFIERAISDGKTIAVPLVVDKFNMEARIIHGLSDLTRQGSFGIKEPPPETSVISKDKIDLAIVPGVCFDKSGHRLGRGAGFYDRYLAGTGAYLVGVCFADFILPHVPAEIHDIKMHALISEKGLSECLPQFNGE